MEGQKHFTLLTLVNFLALVSFVSSQPQEVVGSLNAEANSDTSNESNNQYGPAEESDVCRTEVCKERAQLITEYLNEDFDPCNDFYSYVCDKWINNHTTNGSYDSFLMLQLRFVDAVAHMLESVKPASNPQAVADKPFVLYKSCMAFAIEDERRAILEIMNTSEFRDWPVTAESTNKVKFSNASDVLSRIRTSILIQPYVSKNIRNNTMHTIKIYPLRINLPKEDHINRTVRSVKPNVMDSELKEIIHELHNLEDQWRSQLNTTAGKLAAALPPLLLAPINHLETIFPNIPLRTLLNNYFAKANITVEESETVEVYDPLFYATTNDFLVSVNSTSLYNYMGFEFVEHLLSWSSSMAKDAVFKQRQCVGLVYAAMKEAVINLYARQHFSTQAKMQVEEIVEKIKGAFKEAIIDAKWMDVRTKDIAERKLTKMVAKVGYPPWLLNTTILEDLYKYVPTLYSNISFLEMMYVINENNEKKNMEKLRKPYEKDEEWYFRRSLVNAFFIGSVNEFVYPVGGLQSPFYQFGLPWSLNFGGVGSVIAHEITHAFAGRASGFDKNGAMGNLTNEKFNEFKATTDCFEYQYGNITDNRTNTRLNGTQTLDENMADSSGLQIALTAYEKLVQEDCENTTTRLEGLENMSGLKLFFVASAMLWCNSIGDEKLRNKIVTDSHSANQYRVNVPMRNLKAFAKAFNCSEDSPMMKNIPNTCTLW